MKTQEVKSEIECASKEKEKQSNDDVSSVFSSLRKLLLGKRPLVYLRTFEEDRAYNLINHVCKEVFNEDIPFFRWSSTKGLLGSDEPDIYKDPYVLIEHIIQSSEKAVYFLSDFHQFYQNDRFLIRKLRDLYYNLLDSGSYVFMLSGLKAIPGEAENEIAYMELELPGLDELRNMIEKEFESRKDINFNLETAEIPILSRTLQGLTLNDARHAFHSALSSSGEKRNLINDLQIEKKLQAKLQSLVEFIPDVIPFEHIGGLKNMKEWLIKRKALVHTDGAYSEEIIPKGVLLMGMSGCGKSMSVKAIASLWELPLYRMDMLRVYSGMHGKPEEAFIRACETMERVAPAVLWIDEIEMGIQPGEGQDGTASRIFGYFLTWMQEKKAGLFLATTANRIDLLPAEILRRGRFDQIFFIDLPSEEERFEILRIHLDKRGYDPEKFDLTLLVELTEECNGAEIEQCVVSAIVEAKIAGRELTNRDLISSKRLIVPLSKTMGEQIRRIKQWAFNRATPAS